MARFRVWIDSSAVVMGKTALTLAVVMGFAQPRSMKAQLFAKPETPAV